MHLPHASKPARVSGSRTLSARALPRYATGHLRLAPVRWRDPPLHRRELRAVRDEGRDPGRAAAPSASGLRRASGADAPSRDHVRAGAGRARGRGAAGGAPRLDHRAGACRRGIEPLSRRGRHPSGRQLPYAVVARQDEIAQAKQTVAVIGGTGALGFGLALRWAMAGIPIVIGSRDAGRAAEAAGGVSDRARASGAKEVQVQGLENADAATRANTVVLAVPFRAQSENLNNLRNALQPATLLIDTTVPLAAAVGGRATRALGVPQGSAAQQAAEMAPRGVTVVSAFHTVSAAALT